MHRPTPSLTAMPFVLLYVYSYSMREALYFDFINYNIYRSILCWISRHCWLRFMMAFCRCDEKCQNATRSGHSFTADGHAFAFAGIRLKESCNWLIDISYSLRVVDYILWVIMFPHDEQAYWVWAAIYLISYDDDYYATSLMLALARLRLIMLSITSVAEAAGTPGALLATFLYSLDIHTQPRSKQPATPVTFHIEETLFRDINITPILNFPILRGRGDMTVSLWCYWILIFIRCFAEERCLLSHTHATPPHFHLSGQDTAAPKCQSAQFTPCFFIDFAPFH